MVDFASNFYTIVTIPKTASQIVKEKRILESKSLQINLKKQTAV